MHVAPRRLFENVIVVQYIGLVCVTLITLFGFQAAFGNVLTRANLEVLAMNYVRSLPDIAEGAKAFIEKRAPKWQGKPSRDMPDFLPPLK